MSYLILLFIVIVFAIAIGVLKPFFPHHFKEDNNDYDQWDDIEILTNQFVK